MALIHHAMLAAIALAAMSYSPVAAQENVLPVYEQNGIAYVSGGVGKEESEALQATQANYNLRILNADQSGHFSGDTRIVISDMQHNVLLDATSGPLFYANLPKGRYIIEGFSDDQTKKKTVNMVNGKTVRIRFIWPEDMNNTPDD